MDGGGMTPGWKFVRVLVWMLAIAVLIDAFITKVAYNSIPGYLPLGALVLLVLLFWTRPKQEAPDAA